MVSSFAIILLCFLFAIFGLRLARQMRDDPRLSRSWLLLSTAGFFWAAGEIVWFYYESIRQEDPLFSLADLFFLPFYPLTFIGVFLFPFAPVSKPERTIFSLDLAIVMTTGSMVLWYFILAPVQLPPGSDLTKLIALFYPVAAVPILAAVVALIQRDVEKVARPVLSLLAAGFLCIVVANVLFAYVEINDIPLSMPALNILWLLALQFLLTSVAWQGASEAHATIPAGLQPESPRLLRQASAYLAIFIGLALLALAVTSPSVARYRLYGVLAGTAVQAALVAARQQVVLRENIRLYKETQRLAVTDALTGVYNRHCINSVLRTEVERVKRHPHEFSVLLIDVNGFKRFNDTFGHLQGDVALKAIAAVISSQLRSADLLGRFGGDEFVVLLPETDREGADAVAGRMRSAMAASSLAEQSLSLSIGAASYRDGMTGETLLEEADQELYREKSSHRLRRAGQARS